MLEFKGFFHLPVDKSIFCQKVIHNYSALLMGYLYLSTNILQLIHSCG